MMWGNFRFCGRCRHPHNWKTCRAQSHYTVLGLLQTASPAEIKEAYIQLSKQHHPDSKLSSPDSHDNFVKINKAYCVLSKETSRKEYDLTLNAYQNSVEANRYEDLDHFYWRNSDEYYYEQQYQRQMEWENYFRKQTENKGPGLFESIDKEMNGTFYFKCAVAYALTTTVAFFCFSSMIFAPPKIRKGRLLAKQSSGDTLI